MSILDGLLKRLGIEDYSKLTLEERLVFDRWEKELRGKPVNINDLKKFLEEQQNLNLSQFEDFENPKVKDLYIKVYSRICRQILSFIEAPQKIKEMREESVGKIEKK